MRMAMNDITFKSETTRLQPPTKLEKKRAVRELGDFGVSEAEVTAFKMDIVPKCKTYAELEYAKKCIVKAHLERIEENDRKRKANADAIDALKEAGIDDAKMGAVKKVVKPVKNDNFVMTPSFATSEIAF